MASVYETIQEEGLGSVDPVLRIKSFKAIVSQDIESFNEEENSTGALTTGLADNPQKIFGLTGVTLGVYCFFPPSYMVTQRLT
jgi:hypothetical protein